MKVISTVENCRVQDIAIALSITVGGVSKLIDRIVAKDLCQRQSDPSDGRSAIIGLTTNGKRKLEAATQTFTAAIQNSLGNGLSTDQLTQFQSILGQWRAAIRIQGSVGSLNQR